MSETRQEVPDPPSAIRFKILSKIADLTEQTYTDAATITKYVEENGRPGLVLRELQTYAESLRAQTANNTLPKSLQRIVDRCEELSAQEVANVDKAVLKASSSAAKKMRARLNKLEIFVEQAEFNEGGLSTIQEEEEDLAFFDRLEGDQRMQETQIDDGSEPQEDIRIDHTDLDEINEHFEEDDKSSDDEVVRAVRSFEKPVVKNSLKVPGESSDDEVVRAVRSFEKPVVKNSRGEELKVPDESSDDEFVPAVRSSKKNVGKDRRTERTLLSSEQPFKFKEGEVLSEDDASLEPVRPKKKLPAHQSSVKRTFSHVKPPVFRKNVKESIGSREIISQGSTPTNAQSVAGPSGSTMPVKRSASKNVADSSPFTTRKKQKGNRSQTSKTSKTTQTASNNNAEGRSAANLSDESLSDHNVV